MVGLAAVVLVAVLVVLTGPSDLNLVGRVIVVATTAAFSAWLLREHRRRLPVELRQLILVVCAGVLLFLVVILTETAF